MVASRFIPSMRHMTPEYLALRPGMTSLEALDYVRKFGKGRETLNIVYVTDERGVLLADLRLSTLVMADPEAKVGDLFDRPLVSIPATASREEVVAAFEKYDRVASRSRTCRATLETAASSVARRTAGTPPDRAARSSASMRCPSCEGKMVPVALVEEPSEAERWLREAGLFTPLHPSARARGPPECRRLSRNPPWPSRRLQRCRNWLSEPDSPPSHSPRRHLPYSRADSCPIRRARRDARPNCPARGNRRSSRLEAKGQSDEGSIPVLTARTAPGWCSPSCPCW